MTHHLHAAVFFKSGGGVSGHLLGNNLHSLALQIMFPDKGLAGQNRSSGAVWCWTGERKPTSHQRHLPLSTDRGQRSEALTNTAAGWGIQTPSWSFLPAPNCTHPGTGNTWTSMDAPAIQLQPSNNKFVDCWRSGFSYGLLVECLWFFQAILAKCSGLVPERDPDINTVNT